MDRVRATAHVDSNHSISVLYPKRKSCGIGCGKVRSVISMINNDRASILI